jgi:hypothetical protein
MTSKDDCKLRNKILIIRYNADINKQHISDYTKMYSRKLSNHYDNSKLYYSELPVYIIGSGKKYSGMLLATGTLEKLPEKIYPIEINRFTETNQIQWNRRCWEFTINITSREIIDIKKNNIYVDWNKVKSIITPTLI